MPTQGQSPDRRRLFLALWPDAPVRRQIQAQPVTSGRPIPPENLHITLLFLGAVEASVQQALEAELEGVEAAPFALELDRRGHWKRTGVTWLAASRTPPALESLHRQLTARVAAQGLSVESRPYVAHLTLARKARPEPAASVEPVHWEVDGFVLVESQTLPGGARYRVLRRWPLTVAAPVPAEAQGRP